MKTIAAMAFTISALLVGLSLLPHRTAAQDAEATPEATVTQNGQSTVVCDRAVMLLVAVAVNQYGYESSFDLARFEKGEYQSLFQAASTLGSSQQSDDSSSGNDSGTQGGQVQDPPTAGGGSSDAGGGEVMLSSGEQTNLPRYDGPDRDPSCEELLTEVEVFLLSHLQNQSEGGESSDQASASPTPTAEPTPEATAATNG